MKPPWQAEATSIPNTVEDGDQWTIAWETTYDNAFFETEDDIIRVNRTGLYNIDWAVHLGATGSGLNEISCFVDRYPENTHIFQTDVGGLVFGDPLTFSVIRQLSSGWGLQLYVVGHGDEQDPLGSELTITRL